MPTDASTEQSQVLESAEQALEQWNIPLASLSKSQKQQWEKQELVLLGIGRTNTKTTSARFAGVHRKTIQYWEEENCLRFPERLRIAQERYRDKLEDKLIELIEGLKPGQNAIVLLAALNASLPEKYRVTAVAEDIGAKELIAEVRALARRTKATEPEAQDDSAETLAQQQADAIVSKRGGG